MQKAFTTHGSFYVLAINHIEDGNVRVLYVPRKMGKEDAKARPSKTGIRKCQCLEPCTHAHPIETNVKMRASRSRTDRKGSLGGEKNAAKVMRSAQW